MFKGRSLLIVEDNTQDAADISKSASALGMKPHVCRNIAEYREAIAKKRNLDFALIDIHLSQSKPMQGLEIVEVLVKNFPDGNFIGMSVDPDPEMDRRVRLAGGIMFVRKPIRSSNELAVLLSTAKRINDFRHERIVSNDKTSGKYAGGRQFQFSFLNEIQEKYPHGVIISEEIVKKIDLVLSKDPFFPFLIVGETGTGKEQVAKLIARRRAEIVGESPFKVRNCAELNSSRGESDLFGHVKGAFTGADNNRKGDVALADGGILFLDEIHTLSLGMQEKMLRFLQDGNYQPVGSDEIHESKVQLISATNADLGSLIQSEKFKDDFYFRIGSGFTIKLPTLRESAELLSDAMALYFVQSGTNISETEFVRIYEQATQFYWRGNIRSLYASLKNYLMFASDHIDFSAKFSSIEPQGLNINGAQNGIDGWIVKNAIENNDGDITEKFRKEVVAILKGRGYQTNEIAKIMNVSESTIFRIMRS